MRLIMIYSENVALERRKLELVLFCRNSMEEKKNERSMMILVLETCWQMMKRKRWWWC